MQAKQQTLVIKECCIFKISRIILEKKIKKIEKLMRNLYTKQDIKVYVKRRH